MKVGKLRISAVRNASFVDLKNAVANIGESIQAVAMRNIYNKLGVNPNDIIMIDQCNVKHYAGEPVLLPLRLPLSKDTVDEYLPLGNSIIPFFISLHLHDDIFEGRDDLIDYFLRYAPIGCRDEVSCSFLRKHGISSYIMGCYTLTLPARTIEKTPNTVFLVDISDNLRDVLPDSIKNNAVEISHATPYLKYPVSPQEDERLELLAEKYLSDYRKFASLVITSRLHAAAPCMAMGIPTILATDNADFRYAWIDRFIPVYQINDYSDICYDVASPDNIPWVRDKLIQLFSSILNTRSMPQDILEQLDAFYRNRNKTIYYKSFRNKLLTLRESTNIFPQRFIIWGAGMHSIFIYELLKEYFPASILLAVVDKYKTGIKFGVPIIKPEQVISIDFDYVFITTNPGKDDAISMCKKIFGREYSRHFILLTSQQKS